MASVLSERERQARQRHLPEFDGRGLIPGTRSVKTVDPYFCNVISITWKVGIILPHLSAIEKRALLPKFFSHHAKKFLARLGTSPYLPPHIAGPIPTSGDIGGR
ncbi:hypothetical protein ACFOHS_02255 [Jhaorihella thermophila]